MTSKRSLPRSSSWKTQYGFKNSYHTLRYLKLSLGKYISSISVVIKKPTNCWGRQNAAPLKFEPKPSAAACSTVFSNFYKCWPEVSDDVISGATVDYVDVDVRVKFCDNRMNGQGLIYSTCCQLVPFCALYTVINCRGQDWKQLTMPYLASPKPLDVAFAAIFRTLINAGRK